jgi:hypothetical protein
MYRLIISVQQYTSDSNEDLSYADENPNSNSATQNSTEEIKSLSASLAILETTDDGCRSRSLNT